MSVPGLYYCYLSDVGDSEFTLPPLKSGSRGEGVSWEESLGF